MYTCKCTIFPLTSNSLCYKEDIQTLEHFINVRKLQPTGLKEMYRYKIFVKSLGNKRGITQKWLSISLIACQMFECYHLHMIYTLSARGRRANCPFHSTSISDSSADGSLIAFMLPESAKLFFFQLHIINLNSLYSCIFTEASRGKCPT